MIKKWEKGEKISTVLNWPVLMDGTVPMHILLEVVDSINIEGEEFPKTKAVAIAPMEDQKEIIDLLKRNIAYPPNYMRLKLKELEDKKSEILEALLYTQQHTVEIGGEITAKSQAIQSEIDKRRARKAAMEIPLWQSDPTTRIN